MFGDFLPFTRIVTPAKGDPFWLSYVDGKYYPYRTKKNVVFGIVSPSLLSSYTNDEFKQMYKTAKPLSPFEHRCL